MIDRKSKEAELIAGGWCYQRLWGHRGMWSHPQAAGFHNTNSAYRMMVSMKGIIAGQLISKKNMADLSLMLLEEKQSENWSQR